MGPVAVSRLRLRSPPGQGAATRQRAEDALRAAAGGEERLLVVRRLDLGRLPVAARTGLWSARVDMVVSAARARAVHGSTPGAAGADAVWFRSAAEARALLLMELCAGRRPIAWFWRLAVPDWQGRALGPWLAAAIQRAAGNPADEVALAHALLAAVEVGGLAAILGALAPVPLPDAVPSERPQPERAAPHAPGGDPWREAAALRGRRLLQRHRSELRRILMGLRTGSSPVDAPRAWILRLALVVAAPGLAGQRAQLLETVRALLTMPLASPDDVASGKAPDAGSVMTPAAIQLDRIRAAAPSPPRPRARQGPDAGPWRAPLAGHPDDVSPPREPVRSIPAAAPTAAASEERASAAAGLLLLVRPLRVIGIEGWLERHPDHAADGFGRGLLRHVAHRMRVPPDDPVLRALAGDDLAGWAEALTAWRVGLDRWLRRRTHRKLTVIVRRRGWIVARPEELLVRFPGQAADVALRRRALDVDPGWVPWLGLALRYHYRDEPVA